ncbi:DegV family protein [Alkalicoccus daliensis]|uniref:EDD domain protein, DegV family n=1 Tax=Alkalicoccus daliensis TaxID=745820 RepID=A0A1H0A1R1_9BACI|nr:DegV family protein [Alkalicoccus daliensis]SDN26616.1 EDD domain protein, DegV family [Alkalicoccus daliensis]
MSKVMIVTDSTADIPGELAEKLEIQVVPLKVHFGEEAYEDGVDLSPEEFYKKLNSESVMPSTSQPTPNQFEEVYQKLHKEHAPDIISIHLSSKLSGTFQSAYIAQQTLGESVSLEVIDSKRASYAIGVIVVEAAQMAQQGNPKEEIMARINKMLEDTNVFFMVDTLEYLQKNGRIGKASALVGSLLKIKPILSLNAEGEVYPFEKVRGNKKAVQRILAEFTKLYNAKPLHVGISHSEAEKEAREFMDTMREQFDIRQEVITNIGPVIGAHVGPGTLSIAVTPVER